MAFSQLLMVMIGAIGVTIFAEKRGFQAPLVLALLGLAVSFVPGLPRTELDPEVILSIVLPPLLYSTALEFSFSSFMQRLGSIVNLGVFLVIVTTLVVGFIAALVVPGLALPSALVLAAVVSPPDAVTAVAIGRQLGLPKRLMTILTGESLVNDAAALTLFNVTVAAVAGTHMFIDNVALYFLYSAVVGIVVGLILGNLIHFIRMRLHNPTLMTVLSVLTPFTAFLLAEEFHASGVLAVIFAGFSIGYHSSSVNYASRMQERQIWDVVDMLLESFVFAYIGLQLRFVIQDALAGGYRPSMLFTMAGLVLLAVILVRIGWVFLTRSLNTMRMSLKQHPKKRWRPRRAEVEPLSWQESLVVSWTGMRGVVTLAAAAGIPALTAAGDPFPGRDAIQSVAFLVAVGTLLIQGLSLPWLIKRLDVVDPGEAERDQQQLAYAREVAQQASITAINGFADRFENSEDKQFMAAFLERAKHAYRSRFQLENDATVGPRPHDHPQFRQYMAKFGELGTEVLLAQRNALIAERDAERLDDEAMREVLEQLDLQEAVISSRRSNRL